MARMHEVKDIPIPSRGAFETHSFPVREDLTGVTASPPHREMYQSRFVPKEAYQKTINDFSSLSGEAQRDIAHYAKECCSDYKYRRNPMELETTREEMRASIETKYPRELSKVAWQSDQFLRVVNDHQNKNGEGFRDTVVDVKGRPIFADSRPSVYAMCLGEVGSFASAFSRAASEGHQREFENVMMAARCDTERRAAAVQAIFVPQP